MTFPVWRRRPDRPSAARRTVRPFLEVLEDRVTPAISLFPRSPAFTEGLSIPNTHVATFFDSDPSPAGAYTATIDWGDGSSSTGTVALSFAGEGGSDFEVRAGHAYAEEAATQTFTVTIQEANGSDVDTATQSSTVTVTDAELFLTPTVVAPTAGVPFNGAVASFTDADPNAAAGDFTATINWGDGAATAGQVVAAGTVNGRPNFTVNGGHTYATGGLFSINVTVTDVGGATVSTGFYHQTNLTSDGTEPAQFFDDNNLFGPKGFAVNPAGAFAVADQNASVVTLYDASGNPQPTVIDQTATNGTFSFSLSPSDAVFNATPDFAVPGGLGAATYLFSTNDGDITAWNPAAGAAAVVVVDNLDSSNFNSLAIGNDGAGNRLYAVDVAFGEIRVFDGAFHAVTENGNFSDPNLPATASPESIRNLGGQLYVTFSDFSQSTPQFAVDAFDMQGNFLRRIATDGTLNDPFGLALAPANFGPFSNALLVGNQGDGAISAFNPATGAFLGQLSSAPGTPIADFQMEGLAFGLGGAAGPTDTLYFTSFFFSESADPNLFGAVRFIAPSAADVFAGAALPLSGFEFTPLVNALAATFTFGSPLPASQFSATINWGDGSVTAGTVAAFGGGYAVLGTHTYGDEGVYPIDVRINSPVGGTDFFSQAHILEEQAPGGGDGTPNQRFISEVYRDLFGRPVDSSGLAHWSAQLDAGVSRLQVVLNIENSTSREFYSREVVGLYEQFLHRDPDPTGLLNAVAFLESGGTGRQAAAILVDSPEYYFARAGGTTDGFLRALYADALGRAVDPAGQAGWGGLLAQFGPGARGMVAAGVLGSPEYLQDVAAAAFERYIDRPPPPDALAAMQNALAAGLSDELLAAILLSSDEVFQKAIS